MTTSHNIAGKIDSNTIAIFDSIFLATNELNIPYVVVGATARYVILHYCYGAPVQRATKDIDFAIEVPNWGIFDQLKNSLVSQGFKKSNTKLRMFSPANFAVDIVPFGTIEDESATIEWPPTGEIKMNVLGFQEACDSAVRVCIRDDPNLVVPVASTEGLVLLKIIVWSNRSRDIRRKDAKDIAYLLSSFELIPEVQNDLYNENNQEQMEEYEWDITRAASDLLGQRTSGISKNQLNKRC